MLWVGITGPMGSGKSTVAHLLRQVGFEVIDADDVARKVLSPGSQGEAEVFKTFGQQLADSQGRLDRRALGRLVFADKPKLLALEAIIHPRVQDEVSQRREKLRAAGVKAAFYDVPLLYEKKLEAQFDSVIVVTAEAAKRLERIQTRSQLTVEEIEERTHNHLPAEEKERRATVVIRNDGTLATLQKEIDGALKKLGITNPG